MKRSTNGIAILASKAKRLAIATELYDNGDDLSQIASVLNSRGFRQDNGVLLNYKIVFDILFG